MPAQGVVELYTPAAAPLGFPGRLGLNFLLGGGFGLETQLLGAQTEHVAMRQFVFQNPPITDETAVAAAQIPDNGGVFVLLDDGMLPGDLEVFQLEVIIRVSTN